MATIIGASAAPEAARPDQFDELLESAMEEIKGLRRINELLNAKVETMELFGRALGRSQAGMASAPVTQDIVYKLNHALIVRRRVSGRSP